MATDLVYLRGGHVTSHSVPLSEHIMDQWKRGQLQRVTEDGQTWPGDPFDLSSGEPEAGDADGGDGGAGGTDGPPGRPKKNASQADWAAYAVALGAADEATAKGLTRDQLI